MPDDGKSRLGRGLAALIGDIGNERAMAPERSRGQRKVAIELWTHAIGGLSENDFILAAKIDKLPVEVKK